MRIAVCDDEKLQVQNNANMIKQWAKNRGINISISTFGSAEEFLFHRLEGQPYDLVVLDIQMQEMSGIDLAKHIRKTNDHVQIIFVTGIADHILEGYNVSAINYLLKPYKPPMLFSNLDKAYNAYKQQETGSLMVSHEGRLIRIPYTEILHMEIRGHYFDIYTLTMGQFRAKKKMKDMLDLLDKQLFIQCHRSYIVNISNVVNLGRTDVKLKCGKIVPVSLPNIQLVTQLFLQYHYKHNTAFISNEGDNNGTKLN